MLNSNVMFVYCILNSDFSSILNSEVTFVFMSSFVREYPGRGYVQESIGSCNDSIIASRVTFAVELYWRFAMELLVIFGASFQEVSLNHPVFSSKI